MMRLKLLILTMLFSGLVASQAQPGAPGRVPFRGGMAQLFGDNQAFTAQLLMQTKTEGGQVTIPGKMSLLDRKMRFEMDASKMIGGNMPPGAIEQMKAMGMSEMVSISRPDKKENYIVYPGLKAYAAMPMDEAETKTSKDDLKKTELGKETIDGQPTTKYKVMVKDDEGKDQEVTLWSGSNGFPVRIQVQTEAGPSTITFKDVKLGKPEESLFTPPADFQRHADLPTMMREAMMKRFSAPGGLPAPAK